MKSEMSEECGRSRRRLKRPNTPLRVDAHVGGIEDFLKRQRRERAKLCKKLLKIKNLNSIRNSATGERLCRYLMLYADERNLIAAWKHLRRSGGFAPDPDGISIRDGDTLSWFARLRGVRAKLKDGTYIPGPVKWIKVPKRSGGYRDICVANAVDRIIARAAATQIRPFLETRFDQNSFGFRLNIGTCDALAKAIHITETESSWSWLVQDIATAFDSIPRERLFDLLRWLPPNMQTVIQRLIDPGTRRGIVQGSPLSPLLLNIYLDHFIDRPWRERFPRIPLLRYVDDIVVLSHSRVGSALAHHFLTGMVRNAGLKTKFELFVARTRLKGRSTVDWLGFQLRQRDGKVIPMIADDAWQRLELEILPRAGDEQLAVRQAVRGWLTHLGPTYQSYPQLHRRLIYGRLLRLLAQIGHEGVVTSRRLAEWWRKSSNRYQAKRRLLDSTTATNLVGHASTAKLFSGPNVSN